MSDETEVEVAESEAPEPIVDPFDLSDDELDAHDMSMAPESLEDSPESDGEPEEDDTDDELDVDEEEPSEGEEDPETEEPEPTEDSEEVDFKAEYEKLMAPFNANGKEFKVDSIEESIKLMQMGANYTKKMVELKPNLKMIKMLQKNDILDEGKLSYLIDLSKNNPDAIAKLVKDSGIDPLDINQESNEYTPKNYSVSDKEVNLDEVLGQIESTPTYDQTLDIVGKQWDDSSKEVLSAKPQMIAQINDHVANGIYDKIVAEVDKQQMFGGLEGLSNLEAYQKVGSDLYKRGDFNDKAPVSRSKPKVKQSEAVRNLKKRAASPTKTTPKKEQVKKVVNYFDLSDEELNNLPDKY